MSLSTVIGELQDGIEADLERFGVPGVSWAVIEGGRIVHQTGAGLVDAGRVDAVEADTLFQACSISKPVAVFAMLRLVDRGLLDLDEDVNRRLTSWQVPANADWQPVVTLRQLVSHSAGLTVHGFPGYRRHDTLPTLIQILDGVRPANTAGVRVDTVPATQFRYSGGGTMVMQQLLEDVTGTPFPALVHELVLEPLEMNHSEYAQPLPQRLHGSAATAHDELGEPIDGRWRTYPELAAAGLWTTAGDLATFALAVQDSYGAAEGALLSPDLARELLTPQIPATDRVGGLGEIGLGLFLTGSGDQARFGHGGGNRGYRCHVLAYRETGQGAAVMTNSDNGDWLIEKTLAGIAGAFGWAGYPDEPGEPELPDPDSLDQIQGTYRLRGELSFEVRRSGHRLIVTFAGQQPMEFLPMSAKRFMGKAVRTELHLSGHGGLIFVQGGANVACSRTD